MIAFPEMLVGPAKEAGMKVPDDLENYKNEDFKHWTVFCNVQLGKSMSSPTEHWDHAKIIAKIPESKIGTITYKDLRKKGIEC